MKNKNNTENTNIEGKTRLAKVLAQCGVASRRQAEAMILAGRVAVNGAIAREVTTFVNLEADTIKVDGKPVALPERLRVWIYYKPAGIITTHKDPEGRPTAFEAAKHAGLPHVVSIGRLDINSEGLLIFTNQGAFAHHAESPQTGWKRCYRVRVFGEEMPVDALLQLKNGITIEGYRYDSIDVDFDMNTRGGRNTWLMMTLREGKNREIRRVMNYLGLDVNRLIRLSYGPFELDNLQPGEIREVPTRVLKSLGFLS
jgi:23S rRNA pseudouridine2605 synthase